jgi:hypothetical protein
MLFKKIPTQIYPALYRFDYIGGKKITTTDTHPFWVPDVGWVKAKDLHAETHTGLTTVCNFEVAGFHTHFVSDLGLLVHNLCEIIIHKNSFKQARNHALNLLREINPATRMPIVGKFGGQKGKVVGFETRVDGEYKRFRIDFDPVKGPHINTEVGTGAYRVKHAVQFPGSEEEALKFINQIYN